MKIKMRIEGIECEGCCNRIKNVLSKMKGIISYELSYEEKMLYVEIKNEKVLEEMIEKINNLGFNVVKD